MEAARWKKYPERIVRDVLLTRRPGLEPGTSCVRGSVRWLLCLGLVEETVCFQGMGVVLSRSGRVVSQKFEAYNEDSSGSRG